MSPPLRLAPVMVCVEAETGSVLLGHLWRWPAPWSSAWAVVGVAPPPRLLSCARCGYVRGVVV